MNNETMTFADVVAECVTNADFVKEFNRLTHSNFGQSLKRTPIEIAIDKACGYPGETKEDMAKFIAFVFEFVWLTCPRENEVKAL